ncbi:terpenoid synthase [Daedaleopsis nitida]|nr:terpenoid synthase [Daedaleopsis nitida]
MPVDINVNRPDKPECFSVIHSGAAAISPEVGRCEPEKGTLLVCNDFKLYDLTDEASLITIKETLQEFVRSISYPAPQSSQNAQLRQAVGDDILSWNASLSWEYVNTLIDTSCAIAESAYTHTSYDHQLLIALYTAYLVFADDLGEHNVEAVGQFVQRFTRGQPQLHPALDRLAVQLGTMHEYFPRVSADAIINNTLDSLTAMYIELQTKGDAVLPAAARYPLYLRLKAGIGSAYAHFNFTKSWGEHAGLFYLQMLPDLEITTVCVNDILSFYKESLAGEKHNYIHMRAVAERKPAIQAFREVVDEVLASVRKLQELASVQAGLYPILHSYIMGYIEFHFNARRYHLEDLNV